MPDVAEEASYFSLKHNLLHIVDNLIILNKPYSGLIYSVYYKLYLILTNFFKFWG